VKQRNLRLKTKKKTIFFLRRLTMNRNWRVYCSRRIRAKPQPKRLALAKSSATAQNVLLHKNTADTAVAQPTLKTFQLPFQLSQFSQQRIKRNQPWYK
jgi:hypothetical protein